MQEDAILVKQTLDGDEQAFHRLIMKYYAKIYALILSWMKNPEDAKDLAQEVFLEAYLDLGSLRRPEQFRVWLKQIARHQCQDWLRKEKTYIQLDEDMVCETPSADEMLILRETLAKVMKAIDELPESESQLLKERYLDDASYDDLEAKHGLSQSALAMRLLRAKRHVREKIKLLSGVFALSWHDVTKKIFVGGIEAMKISTKVKFIAIGVVAILILGGTGVIVWHYQQPYQEATSDSSINQITQKASLLSDKNQASDKSKTVTDTNINKSADKLKIDVKNVKTDKQINSAKEVAIQETKEPEIKETPLQKYQRITNSPEYVADLQNAIAQHEEDYNKLRKEAKALLQKKTNLENDLAGASEEGRDKIQKDLEKADANYREARLQACISFSMMSAEGDRILLKYFTPDEFHEAIFQWGESTGSPSPMPLPTKEESESVGDITFSPEEWSEAEIRLNAKGVKTRLMLPPSPALYEKYVLKK